MASEKDHSRWAVRARSRVALVLRPVVPDLHLESIFQLDASDLWQRELRALVFDLDNTLGEWGFAEIDPPVHDWLHQLAEHGFRLGFVSNHDGAGRRGVDVALARFPIIWSAGKPSRAPFRRMAAHFQLAPSKMAMIGDRLLLDVLGAKRLGLYTVMVRPLLGRYTEGLALRFQRTVERSLVAAHRWASAGTDP